VSDLTKRTRELVQEFRERNTPSQYYMMTDGGDGLTYAEKMADLLEEWCHEA
jgi:hypothetical protein